MGNSNVKPEAVSVFCGRVPVWNGDTYEGDAKRTALGTVSSICVDAKGTVFLTDPILNRLARVASEKVTTFASAKTQVRTKYNDDSLWRGLYGCNSIVCAPNGCFYVSNHHAISEVSPNGDARIIAGCISAGCTNGAGSEARF